MIGCVRLHFLVVIHALFVVRYMNAFYDGTTFSYLLQCYFWRLVHRSSPMLGRRAFLFCMYLEKRGSLLASLGGRIKHHYRSGTALFKSMLSRHLEKKVDSYSDINIIHRYMQARLRNYDTMGEKRVYDKTPCIRRPRNEKFASAMIRVPMLPKTPRDGRG